MVAVEMEAGSRNRSIIMAAILTRESVVHTKLRSMGYVLGVFLMVVCALVNIALVNISMLFILKYFRHEQ